MSQKPRTGAQAGATPATRIAAPDAVAKPAPIVTAPDVRAETDVFVEAEAAPSPLAAAPESTQVAVTEPAAVETAEAAPEPATVVPEPITPEPITPEPITAVAIAITPTKPNLTQGMKTMMKTTEDFVAFSQANLEAFVKSGQIWSAGVQELTKQMATSAKASFDESVSTFKALSTVKSVKEAIDLQSTFAKAALEKAMAESNKLTDASIKLTEQTLAPITARVTVAVETFGKAA
jgi:phasin family protein